MGNSQTKLSVEQQRLKNDEKFNMAYEWIKDKCNAYKQEIEMECLNASRTMDPLPGKLPIMALVSYDTDINLVVGLSQDNAIYGAIGAAIDAIWPPLVNEELDGEAITEQRQAENRRKAVCSVIKNVCKIFLGPSKVSTTSSLSEKTSYKIIWSNNSLVRLDVYLVEKQFHGKEGDDGESGEEEHLRIVGYMMIASICDIRKIPPEIVVYELSEYLAQMVAVGGHAAKQKILDEIDDAKDLVMKVGSLYDVVASMQKKMEIEEVVKMTRETKVSMPESIKLNDDAEFAILETKG